MALTTCYMADREGVHTSSIVPDITVLLEANFDNLTDDENIKEAIKFLDQQ